MIQLPIEGIPAQRTDLDQWFTDPVLAGQIVRWSGIGDTVKPITVLEPSAGQGSIVAELLRYDHVRVVAVEIDLAHMMHMRQRFAAALSTGKLILILADFLTAGPLPKKCDLAIMNPPFTFGAEFVARTLECTDRAVALMRTSFLNGVKNYQMVWSRSSLARMVPLVTRPRFGGSFTPAGDYSVFDIVADAPEDVRVVQTEWWP